MIGQFSDIFKPMITSGLGDEWALPPYDYFILSVSMDFHQIVKKYFQTLLEYENHLTCLSKHGLENLKLIFGEIELIYMIDVYRFIYPFIYLFTYCDTGKLNLEACTC